MAVTLLSLPNTSRWSFLKTGQLPEAADLCSNKFQETTFIIYISEIESYLNLSLVALWDHHYLPCYACWELFSFPVEFLNLPQPHGFLYWCGIPTWIRPLPLCLLDSLCKLASCSHTHVLPRGGGKWLFLIWGFRGLSSIIHNLSLRLKNHYFLHLQRDCYMFQHWIFSYRRFLEAFLGRRK